MKLPSFTKNMTAFVAAWHNAHTATTAAARKAAMKQAAKVAAVIGADENRRLQPYLSLGKRAER